LERLAEFALCRQSVENVSLSCHHKNWVRLQQKQDELAPIEMAEAGATIRKTSIMDIPICTEHFRALVGLGEPIPRCCASTCDIMDLSPQEVDLENRTALRLGKFLILRAPAHSTGSGTDNC
jgi:hypothetical protein